MIRIRTLLDLLVVAAATRAVQCAGVTTLAGRCVTEAGRDAAYLPVT